MMPSLMFLFYVSSYQSQIFQLHVYSINSSETTFNDDLDFRKFKVYNKNWGNNNFLITLNGHTLENSQESIQMFDLIFCRLLQL